MSETIRLARPGELGACAALYDRVVRETFVWFDLGDMRAYFVEGIDQEELYVTVDEDDRILAIAGFYRPDNFLHSLYVDVGLNGRGVGVRLLHFIDSIADGPISLKVQVLNLNARRFYAREGFRVLDVGGEPLPSNDRWLLVGRHAAKDAPDPTPRMQISEAAADDLHLCAELYERVAARRAAWEPPEYRTAASKRASFDGETLLAAKEHGVLAGFAAYRPGEAFLHSLFVEPQGAGTGPALLHAVGARLGRPFTLECDERNAAGLRFYAQHGFERIGAESHGDFQMIKLRSDGRWS